jgi:hypothetical protein
MMDECMDGWMAYGQSGVCHNVLYQLFQTDGLSIADSGILQDFSDTSSNGAFLFLFFFLVVFDLN